MKRHSTMLWGIGLVLGWLFDLFFWKQGLGLNFGLYAVLCVAGGVLILAVNQQRPAMGSLLLFPLILVFAGIAVLRAEPLTIFLAVVFTLFLMLVLANTYLAGRWLRYGVADHFNAALRLLGSMLARPLSFQADVRKERLEAGNTEKRANPWPFARGIVIAVPIVAVFASLLASADAAFNTQLDAFLNYFAIQNLPEYIFRLVYILIGAYLLVGVILHASTQSGDEKLLGEDKPLVPAFLGFIEATIVLGSVALLFAAFVVIQFRYFFGGHANINAMGFTYSEYARRGFGELVTVAFFSLLMILVFEGITRRESSLQRRVFSGLGVAIVGLVMVMLVSAYQRLVLYETAYGFSRLRTYTHVALIWIGLLLVAVVVLELLQRQRAFGAAMLIASLGFALSIAALNVDGLIAGQNVERASEGHELDVAYLASLSSDSVPTVVKAFEAKSTPQPVRDSLGAVLFCRQQASRASASTDWRSFTVSRWQAEMAMKRAASQLSGYRALDESRPLRVSTPAGEVYPCYSGGMD
ncbi:MAG: DUF4153 domain-containing protein [Anaerolineae bacterium]